MRKRVSGPTGRLPSITGRVELRPAKGNTRFNKDCHNLPFFGQEGSAMATINVSLPDPMKDWMEDQVKTGQYSNASDYVRM